MRPRFLYIALVSILILTTFLSVQPTQTVYAQASDLIISEYIEGSGLKAIEIYNGTGQSVSLADYDLEIYFNGSSSLSGVMKPIHESTLADGETFVIMNSSSESPYHSLADIFNNFVINFDGDDSLVLKHNGIVIDSFGQVGTDPGYYWGTDTINTRDHTMVRKSTVCTGDTVTDDSFDPALEWDFYPTDYYLNLGKHTNYCNIDVPQIQINEVRIAQTDVEIDEYFELVGDVNTSLDYLTYLVIGGGPEESGIVEEVIDLTDLQLDGNGYFTTAENTFSLGTADLTTDLNFENSDNVTHLLVAVFSGSEGMDLDTNNDGVLDITPWLEIVDKIALIKEDNNPLTTAYHYGPPTVGPDEGSVPDHIYKCDGTWQIGDHEPGILDTPGDENFCIDIACDGEADFIHDIQGTGFSSTYVGNTVVVEGIVIGDFQDTDTGLSGFFLQEEDSDVDGDSATSEGIFVYDNGFGIDVTTGDQVRVVGTVSEYNALTELGSISFADICSTGNSINPATLTLPVSGLGEMESLEGMLVTIPQELIIAEYDEYDRYGEIVLATERFQTFTSLYEPDIATYADFVDLYQRSQVTLDDHNSTQNHDELLHPNGDPFSLTNKFRGGDQVANVTGVLDQFKENYRIQPTQGANYTAVNDRPDAHDDVGGNLKVASFNVLNYFTTLGSRGADTEEEFTRQRTKLIAAISEIDADIVGLIEIENNTEAIQDLVSGLNDLMGSDTYDYVNTGVIESADSSNTHYIKVALIYKPSVVDRVSEFAILNNDFDGNYHDDYTRPALAQTFKLKNAEDMVTVAVNHLKSKGSNCDAVGDPDLLDGAGNCNLTRTAAAEILVDWLETDPTASGSENYLIIGDLNSYAREDPIDAILAGPDGTVDTADDYTDLIHTTTGEDAYSYSFDGQTGYLDHALANAGLQPFVTEATVWHINADEPDVFDYDIGEPGLYTTNHMFEPDAYRSSDHDPVVVGILFNDAPVADNQTVADAIEDQEKTIALVASDANSDPLTYVLDAGPSHGTLDTTSSPNWMYTPDADFYGEDSFTFKVNDGFADSNIASVSITVQPVNDKPSFTKGPPQTANEDSGIQTVSSWASGISAGTNEESQVLEFIVTTDNDTLFSQAPQINPANGDLTFTPAQNTNGQAILTVVLKDDGGTVNGGVDSSEAQTFTITISPVNDPPSANPDSLTTNEDQSFSIVLIGQDLETPASNLTYIKVSNPAHGTLDTSANGHWLYTPDENFYGLDSFTFKVNDTEADSNTATIDITIESVNDTPSFTKGPDITVTENSGLFIQPSWATAISPGPPSEDGQDLDFILEVNDTSLFSEQPSIDPNTGTLSFTPEKGNSGTAEVSVRLKDDGGTTNGGVDTSLAQVFSITIKPDELDQTLVYLPLLCR